LGQTASAFMKKILIIEDEKVLLEVLEKKLINEGYEVFIAQDGEEGLRKMRENAPDLILLDIIMPKKDGFEVLEEMNKDENLTKIPVIIISNSGQPVEIDKALKLGVRDYLIKTEFDPEEVLVKVIKVFGEEPSKEEKEVSYKAKKEKSGEKKNGVSGGKILIVEDDKFLRDLIIKKLKTEDYEVVFAIEGEEALRKIKEEKPDLVLLDLILPGIDGFEVLKQIKSDSSDSVKKIPVIILSNLGQRDDVERGINLGAVDFLIKAHFTPGEIIEKIKVILSKAR
jgi:DNA-binding response OmpR family regulator